MKIYFGEFDSWDDVAMQFSGLYDWRDGDKEKALQILPEPEKVILAAYDQPGYEGYALVVYKTGETYYTVYGSHCSCYGLEDQFTPEAYTKEDLLAYFEKIKESDYGVQKDYAQTVIDNVNAGP